MPSVATYKANHKGVKVWEMDIRDLEPSELSADLGLQEAHLDLLAGCPPCQGFSTIRTLNGAIPVDDARNDLLFEFLRFAESLLPRAVMLENVPGLATDPRFATFCKRMEEIGYTGDHRVLNAAAYGVAQRRRRLIYLAGLGQAMPFAEPTRRSKTIRRAIGGLAVAGVSGDIIHDLPERRTKRIADLIRRIPEDGGSRGDLPLEDQLDCHKRCDGFKDVYGRMSWDEVSPTITSGCFNPSKGRFLHPKENRAITMREAALLQGFPRGYKFPLAESKTTLASMIGNALPPPFVAAHARAVARKLDQCDPTDGDPASSQNQ